MQNPAFFARSEAAASLFSPCCRPVLNSVYKRGCNAAATACSSPRGHKSARCSRSKKTYASQVGPCLNLEVSIKVQMQDSCNADQPSIRSKHLTDMDAPSGIEPPSEFSLRFIYLRLCNPCPKLAGSCVRLFLYKNKSSNLAMDPHSAAHYTHLAPSGSCSMACVSEALVWHTHPSKLFRPHHAWSLLVSCLAQQLMSAQTTRPPPPSPGHFLFPPTTHTYACMCTHARTHKSTQNRRGMRTFWYWASQGI